MILSTENIWDIKAETKGRSDFAFFVTNDKKYAIYFSQFSEYAMLKFISPIQVWIDKQNPKLIFNSNKIQFEYQD